ncbi:hypothetical protein BD779DRAFT_351551 [Infundibulicybe gibba]|nr:hypothetical protein BD779DRAFT_351551 [Infundibulicybe gibba]
MDLNDEKLLDTVMAYLDGHCDVIPPGQELWLRDAGPREGGFSPLRWLVDHSKQSVAFNPPRRANGDGEGHPPQYGCGDDRLDAKYRYWSFMESHPAHTSLPLDAHQEAINSLNWASTNGLLPPIIRPPRHSRRKNVRASLPSFDQQVCHVFHNKLKRPDSPTAEKQGETPFRTNTVSKILLRAICRRQSHSRPDKPLPADAGRRGLHRAGHPAPINSSALVLMAVVYACLAIVAALCLLSQTFMRIAGVGAILIFSSLAVSNIVAVAQSEADDGSIALHVRRAILILSRKDHTVADSEPLASLPWYVLLWRGLESRLYRALIPKPFDAIRATAAKST